MQCCLLRGGVGLAAVCCTTLLYLSSTDTKDFLTTVGWLAGGRQRGPQAVYRLGCCTPREGLPDQGGGCWVVLVVVVVCWWDINIILPPVLHKSVIMLHDDMIIYHAITESNDGWMSECQIQQLYRSKQSLPIKLMLL